MFDYVGRLVFKILCFWKYIPFLLCFSCFSNDDVKVAFHAMLEDCKLKSKIVCDENKMLMQTNDKLQKKINELKEKINALESKGSQIMFWSQIFLNIVVGVSVLYIMYQFLKKDADS